MAGIPWTKASFKMGMASLIFLTAFAFALSRKKTVHPCPSHWSFGSSLGVLAGFTTMIGNLAGAVTNIYFLAMRLPKNAFIGTSAFVFFMINLIKIPFHVWVWGTINLESVKTSLQFLPFLDRWLVVRSSYGTKINDENYRKLILVLTAIGSIVLFFR